MRSERTPGSRALVKTSHPGIYRRGQRYVVTWKECGKSRKQSCATLAEALRVQGERRGIGAARSPVNRELFRDYGASWLEGYRGRTARGLGELTRDVAGQVTAPYVASRGVPLPRRSP